MELTKIEQKAAQAENIKFFNGIKVSYIRDKVEEILINIGKNGFFEEYTLHDISHIDEMLSIVEWLIPQSTQDKMTWAEWLMLVLSIYFHDMGMLITKNEFNGRENTKFGEYKSRHKLQIENLSLEEMEKLQYQEYVRENHAKRIKKWITGDIDSSLGECKEIIKILHDILNNLDPLFKRDLGVLCESHHYESIDNLDTNVQYSNSPQAKVNLHYISVLLRVADLLSISSRTPSIQYCLINPSNPKSLLEWQKQMSVKSVSSMPKTDENGTVKTELLSDTIQITAYFDNPDLAEGFFGLMSYIKYVEKELNYCYNSVKKIAKLKAINDYEFPWQYINSDKVEAEGFEPKQLQFTINQEKILQLLIGHTLYNESTVTLRELIQNSIDAIKLQRLIMSNEPANEYVGNIEVHWDSATRQLEFWDNGTGMTCLEIENYLLKVGASKYSAEDFQKKYNTFKSISKFGIGILTCFMIADNIDIVTSNEQENQANFIAIRNVDGKYLLKKINKNDLDPRIKSHGTHFTLHVRENVDMHEMVDNIKKWILLPDCKVDVYYDKELTEIGYKSPKDALEDYLKQCSRFKNFHEYKVVEDCLDGIKIAYILKYNPYMQEWKFCTLKDLQNEEVFVPIGTCVEGIRVEFDTPGYTSKCFITLVDIRDGSNQINVARSALEWGSKDNPLLSKIYELYAHQIHIQIEELLNKGYSKDWVASEAEYLTSDFLSQRRNRYINDEDIKPIDENVLIKEFNKIKCIIIESGKSREFMSPSEIQNIDEITIIDSKMVDAAEDLLKEVKSQVSLNDILAVFNNQSLLQNVDNIFCDYNKYSVLHKSALKNKQVKRIEVDKNQRRINLLYSNNVKEWEKFSIPTGMVNLPINDFKISGIEDDIGVKVKNEIFLDSGNSITNYIVKMKEKFNYKASRDELYLFRHFLASIFDGTLLGVELNSKSKDKTKLLDNILRRSAYNRRTEINEKLWAKVDKAEFAEILLAKKYKLYSISDWYRKEEE